MFTNYGPYDCDFENPQLNFDGLPLVLQFSIACSLGCGWWLVLICYERKVLLIGWWLVLI